MVTPKKITGGPLSKISIHLEKSERVLECCRVPQFSDRKLSFWFEDEYLFLGFEKTNDPFKTRLLHIESGMQQEAVYLACTALELGTCIHNLGINGTEYRNKIAIIVAVAFTIFYQDLAIVANDALQSEFMSHIVAITLPTPLNSIEKCCKQSS